MRESSINDYDEQDIWMDLEPINNRKEYFLPLYDHPHNDIENGQSEVHYHQNTKFKSDDINLFQSFKNGRIVLPLVNGEYLKYKILNKITNIEKYITPVHFIKNSKLKHNCIHNNKCPHRGYDLSNEKPINGIITCPLHGLMFNAETKQLIKP